MIKELKELMNEPLENVTVIPDETNTQKWTVEIRGPVRDLFPSGKQKVRRGVELISRRDHHM
jgi:ubiquitin-protein ligase